MKSGSQNGKQYFTKGSQVEVSSNEDGFKGSYFVASILEDPPQIQSSPSKKRKRGRKKNIKNELLVEYQSLLTEDHSKPLREYADLGSIRPLPPLVNEEEESLGLNHVVDAYYEGGWWIGVITKALEESKRFSVFFTDPPHVIDFDRSDLRVHFDWVAGKWIRHPMHQEVLGNLVCQKQLGYANNSADKPEEAVLESSSAAKESAEVITQCQIEKSTSHNGKSPFHVVYSSKKKMNQAIPATDATHSHPSKKLKEGSIDTSVVVSAVKSQTVPVGMAHETEFSVSTTPTMGGIGNVCSKAPEVSNQPSAKTESGSAMCKKRRKSIAKKRRGRPPKSSGKVCNGVEGASGEIVVKDCTPTEVGVSVITEVESTTTWGIQHENTNQLNGKVCSRVGGAAVEMVVKDCTSTDVGVPIIAVEESTTIGGFRRENTNQLTGKVCSRVGGAAVEMVVKDCTSTDVGVPIIAVEESTTIGGFRRENTNQLTGKVCNEVVGAADETVMNDGTCTEIELPLLTKVESTTTGASQPENSHCRTVNQWNEARERQVETAIQEPAMDTPSDRWPDENQSLPFVKNIPIWRAIESGEVFQKMPQKPHFHPLRSREEVWREGLAVASMVTFASVVAMTSNLKFDDPKRNFDRILEALSDLEMHGFDVKAVRNRLNHLLSIKASQEQLGVKVKEIGSQIMERTREKTHMEEEINEFVKMIKDLEEKQAILLSTKKDKESEIVRLRSSMDVISEGIQNAQHEFESVAAASW